MAHQQDAVPMTPPYCIEQCVDRTIACQFLQFFRGVYHQDFGRNCCRLACPKPRTREDLPKREFKLFQPFGRRSRLANALLGQSPVAIRGGVGGGAVAEKNQIESFHSKIISMPKTSLMRPALSEADRISSVMSPAPPRRIDITLSGFFRHSIS